MTEEEKKAIKSMKRFVECRQDMTAVTASEMKIVLDLLEKKDKESHFIQSELDIANAKIIELNKIIDLMSEEIAKTDDDLCEYIDQTTKKIIVEQKKIV